MEIKLFGKNVFSFRTSKRDALLEMVNSEKIESKFLPDFQKKNGNFGEISNYVTEDYGTTRAVKKEKGKKKGLDIKLTPKGVYEMKLLNDETFELNTNEEYVDDQIIDFKDKLEFIKSEEYHMRNGVEEITSVLIRLENRKKYEENKEFFSQFPYTKTSKIANMLNIHDNLKLDTVAQFVADMPKEAVEIMKEYNENTKKVCGKQAVFYIIADKKDFKKMAVRKDPILLAQSPFGHFWQILGAWDKEMMFLEEL